LKRFLNPLGRHVRVEKAPDNPVDYLGPHLLMAHIAPFVLRDARIHHFEFFERLAKQLSRKPILNRARQLNKWMVAHFKNNGWVGVLVGSIDIGNHHLQRGAVRIAQYDVQVHLQDAWVFAAKQKRVAFGEGQSTGLQPTPSGRYGS
jgi:hypothetical protein